MCHMAVWTITECMHSCCMRTHCLQADITGDPHIRVSDGDQRWRLRAHLLPMLSEALCKETQISGICIDLSSYFPLCLVCFCTDSLERSVHTHTCYGHMAS